MSNIRHEDGDFEALSAFVTADNQHDAERFAKIALIADGRTPGHVIHVEQLDGREWEIVYTDRPLMVGQAFLASGQRVGNAGTKADWR